MKKKLFNKDIPPKCEYCRFSSEFGSENQLLCKYKGVVECFDSCRKYKYDILKRKPQTVKLGNDYSDEDFVL